jgi:hypothetical protein
MKASIKFITYHFGLFREVSLADYAVALVASPVNTFYAFTH